MTYRQTETSREIRLWIGQVLVPLATLLAIPEVRNAISTKYREAKQWLKSKIDK